MKRKLILGICISLILCFCIVGTVGANSAEYWYNKGFVEDMTGNYADAVAFYDKSLSMDPYNVAVWFNRGSCLASLDRHSEAVASYDQALAIIPPLAAWKDTEATTWHSRGNSLAELGRYSEAVASYDEALAINPNDAKVREARQIAVDAQAPTLAGNPIIILFGLIAGIAVLMQTRGSR